MGTTDQLKLLLWKDFLVRRRHLSVATLVFGWAIAVFLVLYAVRESIDLEYSPTCQYTARNLPSTGLFPFVQSFICNVDNKCNNLSSYEEVPQYKNASCIKNIMYTSSAKCVWLSPQPTTLRGLCTQTTTKTQIILPFRLTGVAKQLEGAFTNETIISVVKSLPNMITLLKTVGAGLDSPNLEGIFGLGIKIRSLFENPNLLIREIKHTNPKLDAEVIDEIFESSLKVGHLFKSIGSTDIGSSICNPGELKKYLILQNPDNIEKVSAELCNISGDKVPSLLQNVFDHGDFTGLLDMVGKTVDNFMNYDMFLDLQKIVEIFLGLNFIKDIVPEYLKLHDWVPEIIPLMKNINKTHVDKDFVLQALEIIEPHFNETALWPKFKNLILHTTDLLIFYQNAILAKGPFKPLETSHTPTFQSFVNQLQTNIEKLKNPSEKDLTERQEVIIKIANDTINALPAFYLKSEKPWLHIANILDSITVIMDNNVFNVISTISYIYSQSILALENSLRHEYESEKIMYSLCEKHSNIVSTLFSLGPEFITNMLYCFGNITCTSIIVANKNNISQIFCDKNKTEEILPEASSVKNIGILCNIEMEPFIQDLIADFNLDWINKTITESEKRLNATNKLNDDSFTLAVENTERLFDFIQNRKNVEEKMDISWELLFPDFENTEWSNIANKARKHAGLYVVNVELSYLKESLKHKTHLNKYLNASSILMEGILSQYNLIPKSLLQSLLLHLPSVTETIIKIFANNTQRMMLESMDNWEHYFCNNDDENNVTMKIICEGIIYLNMQSNKPWFRHPLGLAFSTIIHNYVINGHEHRIINWDRFISNAQNVYLKISEIVSLRIPKYNWEEMEVFQSKYWFNWVQNLDITTEIRFGIQLVTKIGDIIEKNYFDPEYQEKWQEIQTTTSSVNHFLSFFLNIIDFAISSENNGPIVSNLYPETYKLSQIVIKNFDSLILDLEKFVNDKNTDFSKLANWFKHPCKKDISFILRQMTAESIVTLKAIQNGLCNVTKFEKEWKLAGVLSKQNKTSMIYGDEFQETTSKLIKILQEVHEINPGTTNLKMENLKQIETHLKTVHKETNFEKLIFSILDKILETSVMRQDTMRDLWNKLKHCLIQTDASCKNIESDTAHYSAKFVAVAVKEIATRMMQYLHLINGTEGVDPLRLIGFSNTSAIYTTYLKFPDFVKLLVYSYRSPEFENKIFEQRSIGKEVSCNEVLTNLIIPENNSVTKQDILALSRYVCPSFFDWPIMQDNLFLSTITKMQDIYLDVPVSKLDVSFVSVSNILFDLKTDILDMAKYGKFNIKQLWNKIWTEKVVDAYKDIKKLKFNSTNTLTRYFKYIDLPDSDLNISVNLVNPKFGFGDLTFFLQEITNALNNLKALNLSTAADAQEDIEQIQELTEFHSKEVASVLSYIYFKTSSSNFWNYFDEVCKDLTEEALIPLQIKKNKNVLEKLCSINNENVRNKLLPVEKLREIKNYNVNLEEIIIQFLTTLENFANNNDTIYLSSTITKYFDLGKIFNHSFPTDEQLRNSSLEKAQLLSDKPLEILSDVAESLSATTIVLKLLQGGDWWQTLLHNVEEPRIKFWLEILERIPTVILHISDAAVSPHLLYDITSNIVTKGYKIVCDDNFNLKKYIRDSNLVYIVKNACSRRGINDTGIQELYMNGTNIYFIYKQDKMAEIIYNFEKSLVDLVKQGPKPFYLPKWMNETEIVREYKDYAVQNSKPLKLLSTVTNVINEIIDIGSVFYKNNTNNCTWCNWATVLVREANKQLSQSQKYTDFLCNIPNMNIFEIRDTLTNDFKWGEFYEDIVNNKNSVEDFDMEIHDIVDVIKIQLITFYTNKTLQDLPEKCFSKIADSPALKNISTYISAIRELTKTFKNSSLQFFKNPLFTNITTNLSNAIETYIPILKPLESVLKEENNLTMDLKKMEINDDVIAELLSSKIDVNTLHRINNSEELGIYFTNRDYFNKLFSFINDSFARSIHNEFVFNDTTNLDNIFYDSIDENKLHKKIPKWRSEAAKSLNWVAKIFESLEKVIFNGGNILEFVANVDFGELSAGHFNISTMLRGILDLLEKNSIEKLFQSLRELIKSISPLIRNEIYENDLYELLDGVENMEIFRNLGLVRLKYNISDFIKDWKNVKQYLTQDLNLEESVVDNILNASIDLSEIISSQGNSMNIQSTVCDPKELLNIITFNSENVTKTAEEVSATLCNISMNEIRSLANVAFKHINLTRALSKIMNSTVNNILSSANMTEDEGKKIVKNIGVGADLLPYLKTIISNLSIDMNIFPKSEKLESNQKTKRSVVVSSDLLASVSTLLCGRPLIQSSNKLYKVISQAKDFNADKNDAIERNTLPTDFCVNIYKDVINMEIGKLIWAYVKPLLRGQILYTPDTPAVRTILKNANSTFAAIAELQDILFKITDSLIALEDREQIEHIFDNIQDFLNSSIVQTAVQSAMKSISNSNISIKDLNLKSMLNSFGNLEGITSALKFGSNFLRCVLLNRFVGVDTEEQLEQQAKILMRTNEFIAGIVFLNMDKSRQKRSVDLPNEISYKIRMDIDSVPSTSYMKYKFWTPDPESDFLEERYFRGFIQLQDLIDTAIIQLKAPKNLPKWETLTQEMPYPCWTKDFFKSALAVSQSFQVCFFFALIAVVAAAVRYIVWEKESGNTMVMNVMGLRYLTHCTSWFIVTFIEMLFAIICIFVILKVGGIITLSNSMLLFLYLLEFGFSVIMFCYMISSIFNSASLAAVGSAIFYLITYMPYIIIISLETTLDFWARLLTNFSMSSSFCYGCLYMIRFELQGVGLQWNNVWDTPIPGDSMSFGLTCIFLLIDSILYGLIGYICSKKSQGENYLDDTISSTNVVNDEPLRIGVTIKGLTKSYNSRKKTVKAIENIDITLYTGQVTTLLGHNGAGKTTLIKILTGMMQPTSGQIIINSEITENEKHKSKFLGVCPQGSVLINTMTPLEHLIFYAKLKTSRSTEEVMPEIVEMIDSMSLGRLSHEPVSHLSEGMRRRLCVAIAFIGKPKLVVLDEPSSGVDPVARRQIWDLVIRYKKGCTVLLTTHYLDEAELLSDRVVVLHKGKVLCSGSPLILRQSYGSGYKVTVNYPIEKEIHQINDTTVDATVSLVKKIASNAYLSEIRGFTFDITIPFNSTDGIPNNFENVASTLEDNQINLGFLNFNMNCATLEQVFLDLCERADVKENDLMNNSDTISQLGRSYSNIFNNSIEELPINKVNEVLIESGEKLTGKNSNKFFALLKKRAIHCMFDWRVIVCALVLPTVFTAIAMGFSLIRPPNSTEPPLKLTPELYQDHTTSFISVDTNDMESFINKVSREIVGLSPHKNLDMYTKSSRNCVCETGKQMCAKSSNPSYDSLLKLPSANDTVDWIIETQHEYIERRYGGWSLSDQLSNKSAMIVWYLNKGYHSMPSYLNTMNSAILRTVSPGSLITTYSHPLQLSVAQLSRSTIIQHIADVGIAMVLLIAFSLVPASGSIYLVQERVNEEKRMQFLSGVSPTLYWVVAFVWDLMVLLCSLLLAVIVFKIFGLPVYVARENLAAVSLLIFLYGWACIPFVHLTQRLFNDASIANMILFCICAFIGIAELICLLLMDILGKTQFVADLRDVLHSIYLIFPQFVLGDGLVEISKNNIQAEILERFHMDTYVSPLSWELMGVHYLSLALVGVILFVINLVLENEWLKASKEKNAVYPVKASCLEIVNLSKVYNSTSGKQVAVNDVSLNVSFGQCLGLIGVNGAGKSTTFKMLTTEIRPTSGRIFLQGREICRKPLYTGEMGYCPQSDSLDPKLTVRQTLKLYLTLRGIENKNEILNKIMSKFELTSYANRKNENLSGGNKRKVCMALSVLGKTSLILMDEPTSGMDPYSRNLVGFTIQQLIKQNRSVILTSHSVEDCEALCSNVAVMINGKIICEGSPQDLKERYGAGYIISVRLDKPTDQDLLLELMKKNFPGAEQMSRQYCSSQYAIPTDKTKISEMFHKMSKITQYASVEDFNLVQSSLDQVFINLANKSEATTSVNLETKPLPNMYCMDVIS